MIACSDLDKDETWFKLTTIDIASIITADVTDEQHPSCLIFGPNRSITKVSPEELMLQLHKLMTMESISTNGETSDYYELK